MFNDTLIELVKNVRCDRDVNIAERKTILEWVPHFSRDQVFPAELLKVIGRCSRVEHILNGTQGSVLRPPRSRPPITKLAGQTPQACSILGTCHQALFWVVGDIAGKNGMYLVHLSIPPCNFNPLIPSLDEWFQNNVHRVMK